MVNKEWRFTPHARYESWEERFSEYDIKDAINRSVLWGGGQSGKDQLFYDSVSGAVFVVSSDGWVKTVLTLDMAIANMQSRNGFACKLDFGIKKTEHQKRLWSSGGEPDKSVGSIIDKKCFECAELIFNRYTKEEFEESVKEMCSITKDYMRRLKLRAKEYSHEWIQVNKYLYKLWSGELTEYNDVIKKQLQKV